MNEVRTGGCLCGAIRFRTTGALRGVVYCHCSQCRRQTGHFYAATDIEDECLSVQGSEHLTWYAASDFARRGFCRICGSAMFWKHNGAAMTSILAGSFDQPSGLVAEAHIFVGDKADYYQIDDGLPQYVRSTPAITVAPADRGDER